MKLLLDACIWGGAATYLREAGHDVIWAGDWDTDPGDAQILALAHQQQRVLITLDKDFGELAIVRRVPHSGIVRLAGLRAAEQGAASHALVGRYSAELSAGGIVTVERTRVRVRSADTGADATEQ